MSADNLTKREQVAALVLHSLITVYCPQYPFEMFSDETRQGLTKSAVLYAEDLLLALSDPKGKS